MEIHLTNITARALQGALDAIGRDKNGDTIKGYPSWDKDSDFLIHYRLRHEDDQGMGMEMGSASLIFGSVVNTYDIRITRQLASPSTLAFIEALIRYK